MRFTMQIMLTLFVTTGQLSCDDGSCPTAARYEQSIRMKTDRFKELGFMDGVLAGFGLSSECQTRAADLRRDVEGYRDHLYTCQNSRCRAVAPEKVKQCNQTIDELRDLENTTDLISALRMVVEILSGI